MNDQIRKSYKTGLSVLKPSKRDLEYGVALHRNALVIDAYGDIPFAAGPDEVLFSERKEAMEAWNAAGVTCLFQQARSQSQGVTAQLRGVARFTHVTDLMSDVVFRVVKPDDIVRAKSQNQHCICLATNAVPFAEKWETVDEELSYIRVFAELGVRMMHLTYNRRNMLGDGCGESTDAGLSDLGRVAIKEMNRVGVIVDVAHSGQRTSLEAARASSKPIVASHSACAALSSCFRCKSDEVIRAIAETGGYLGIIPAPNILRGSGDIVALLDHIDYAVKTFGSDHVAIGVDQYYGFAAMNRQMATLPHGWKPKQSMFSSLAPTGAEPEWWAERMLESLEWTNFPLFTVGMVQRGLKDEDIRKVLGDNVLRVAKAVFPDLPCSEEAPV